MQPLEDVELPSFRRIIHYPWGRAAVLEVLVKPLHDVQMASARSLVHPAVCVACLWQRVQPLDRLQITTSSVRAQTAKSVCRDATVFSKEILGDFKLIMGERAHEREFSRWVSIRGLAFVIVHLEPLEGHQLSRRRSVTEKPAG